ncbi:HD-GYP domain-containing protein [Bacillus coahuilensis]|uniref:HD-GYP domain-containing protein n=1 Tax=Bacillus coahuilensis TaxID=408580 RepID=UPI000750786F|nr:HD-GYP domain-containing protein [Bacillus coahuilensis]
MEAEKGIESLILAIEMVDDYTKGHSKRVQEYSLLFGETLKRAGYPVDLDVLSTSSILHDVGKLQIPAAILQKKGRLTDEEFEVIKKHPVVGAEIAEKLNYSKDIISTIYHHHERYDGKGYPSQIAGENIPFLSRVITVCDTFDALTSNRSYRNALTPHQAKEIILENMGTQFDPSFEPYFRQVYPSLEEIALNKSEVQIAPTLFSEKYGS